MERLTVDEVLSEILDCARLRRACRAGEWNIVEEGLVAAFRGTGVTRTDVNVVLHAHRDRIVLETDFCEVSDSDRSSPGGGERSGDASDDRVAWDPGGTTRAARRHDEGVGPQRVGHQDCERRCVAESARKAVVRLDEDVEQGAARREHNAAHQRDSRATGAPGPSRPGGAHAPPARDGGAAASGPAAQPRGTAPAASRKPSAAEWYDDADLHARIEREHALGAVEEMCGLHLTEDELRTPARSLDEQQEYNARYAAQFRDFLANNTEWLPCAVCGAKHSSSAVQPCSLSRARPLLGVLRRDLPGSPRVPRDGSNTWRDPGTGLEYCLLGDPRAQCIQAPGAPLPQPPDFGEGAPRPPAVSADAPAPGSPASLEHTLWFCSECFDKLEKQPEAFRQLAGQQWEAGGADIAAYAADAEKYVPHNALARCDRGRWPAGLEPLTLVEQLFLCVLHPRRHIMFLRGVNSERPRHLQQLGHTGHTVAYNAPGAPAIAASLPLENLDGPLVVVFIGVAATDAEARAQISRYPALRVDGAKVVRWARFLSTLPAYRGRLAPEERLAVLERVRGVPESVVQNAVIIREQQAVATVERALRADVEGYARTRFGRPEEQPDAAGPSAAAAAPGAAGNASGAGVAPAATTCAAGGAAADGGRPHDLSLPSGMLGQRGRGTWTLRQGRRSQPVPVVDADAPGAGSAQPLKPGFDLVPGVVRTRAPTDDDGIIAGLQTALAAKPRLWTEGAQPNWRTLADEVLAANAKLQYKRATLAARLSKHRDRFWQAVQKAEPSPKVVCKTVAQARGSPLSRLAGDQAPVSLRTAVQARGTAAPDPVTGPASVTLPAAAAVVQTHGAAPLRHSTGLPSRSTQAEMDLRALLGVDEMNDAGVAAAFCGTQLRETLGGAPGLAGASAEGLAAHVLAQRQASSGDLEPSTSAAIPEALAAVRRALARGPPQRVRFSEAVEARSAARKRMIKMGALASNVWLREQARRTAAPEPASGPVPVASSVPPAVVQAQSMAAPRRLDDLASDSTQPRESLGALLEVHEGGDARMAPACRGSEVANTPPHMTLNPRARGCPAGPAAASPAVEPHAHDPPVPPSKRQKLGVLPSFARRSPQVSDTVPDTARGIGLPPCATAARIMQRVRGQRAEVGAGAVDGANLPGPVPAASGNPAGLVARAVDAASAASLLAAGVLPTAGLQSSRAQEPPAAVSSLPATTAGGHHSSGAGAEAAALMAAALGNTPQAAAAALHAADAALPASGVFMRGISDIDVILGRNADDNIAATIGGVVRQPELLQRLLAGGKIAVPRDTRPEHFADDYHPLWFMFTHPESFPNGTGACPEGMTLANWGQLLLRRWYAPDDPGMSPYFIIDQYDVWARHEVNRLAYVKLELAPGNAAAISQLTCDQAVLVINLMRRGLMGAALGAELSKLPHGAQVLYDSFKFVSSRVRGTPQAFRILRSHYLGGAWMMWGAPTMSMNVNPSPLDSHLAMHFAGRTYKFSAAGDPINRPDILERWRLMASNPRAASEYFRLFMGAVCEVLLGWPVGAPKQQDPDCPFGHVLAWFFKFENSQGGDLHAHGCIWQAELSMARLQEKLASEETAAEIVTFLERVSCAYLPRPEMWAYGRWGPEYNVNDWRGAQTGDENQVRRRRPGEEPATACLPPLSAAHRHEGTYLMAQAQMEKQVHRHTATCAEHGGEATDEGCRLGWPRRVMLNSVLLPNGRGLVLRRAGTRLVNCTPALMLAQPCNHFVYAMVEMSRWLRQLELWQAAHPGVPVTDASAPQMPTFDVLAADVGEYAIAYDTKEDGMEASLACLETTTLFQERLARHHPAPGRPPPATAAQDRAGFTLRHACNASRGAYTQAVNATALYASGHPAYLESHQFSAMDFNTNANHLLQGHASLERGPINPRFSNPHLFSGRQDDAADAAAAGAGQRVNALPPGLSQDEANAWNAYTTLPAQVFDYLYRGPALRDLSPMIVTCCYYLAEYEGSRPIAEHSLRLDLLHPLWETHVWHRYRVPRPPQLLRDPPLPPAADTSAGDHEIYGAFILGNFTAFDYTTDVPYGHLYSRMQSALSADSAHDCNHRLLCHFERNARSRAGVHARGHARMQRQQQAQAAGDTAAAAAAVLHADPPAAAGAPPAAADEEPDADDLLAEAGAAAEDGDFDEAVLLQQRAEERGGDTQALLAAMRTATSATDRRALQDAFLVADTQRLRNDPFVHSALVGLGAGLPAVLSVPASTATQQRPEYRSAADAQLNLSDVPERLRAADAAAAAAAATTAAAHTADTAATKRLSLHRSQPSGDITLRLHILPDPTSAAVPTVCTLSATEDPPFVRLPNSELPSPEDTVRIFRLDAQQEQPFLQLAYTLLTELRGRATLLPAPLMTLVPGPAGAGKSRVVVALEWFSYQHQASHLVAVASYTWRGALQITTPGNDGITTTTLFCLGRKPSNRAVSASKRLQNNLAGRRILIIDEVYFISLTHLAAIASQAAAACKALEPDSPWLQHHFGYFHVAIAGDLRQHVAPYATPLITAADVDDQDAAALQSRMYDAVKRSGGRVDARRVADAMHGYRIYRAFRDVFMLTRQYRLEGDEQHLRNVMLFEGRQQASRSDVEQLCNTLQSRTLSQLPPALTRAVVLRHRVQVYANRLLALHHAKVLREHIFIWRSQDTTLSGQPLPPDLANKLDDASFKDTGGIPTINFFFRGCLYVFGDADRRGTMPHLHVVSNNGATGVDILLTPEDAAALQHEDPDQTVHVLSSPPEAIIVRPDGDPLPDLLSHPAVPAGCIPVLPLALKVTYKERRDTPAVQFIRRGYDLQDAYAVTDFFSQGMSFRATPAVWAAHLTPPPGRMTLQRANVYVTLSRFSTTASVNLLAPLWPPDASEQQRSRVVDAFLRCAQYVPTIAAELRRLADLDAATRNSFPAQLITLRHAAQTR